MKLASTLLSASIFLAEGATTIPRACVPPHDKYDFCNASKGMDDRIASLVGMLTNVINKSKTEQMTQKNKT
jgi:hypothetical protein